MDEPFGALDEIVRDHLNEQLLKLWKRTHKTIGFVTHSIPEAVYLSTKIVVMSPRPGRITDVIESSLPEERPLNIRDSEEFIAIAQRVREGLRAGARGMTQNDTKATAHSYGYIGFAGRLVCGRGADEYKICSHHRRARGG
ncbi:hypothetical protein N9C22_06020, partial [Paracoccaceae bacterium]|nr:hypothetical protein [Paracoccaceae bacterium]